MSKHRIDNQTNRRKIPGTTREAQKKLHIAALRDGLALGYRKGKTGGSWIARRRVDATRYEFEPLGQADDAGLTADGLTVLSYDQAKDKAEKWFQQRVAADTGEVAPGSYTVADAMSDYFKDRERKSNKKKSIGRDRSTSNAHIIPALGNIELSKLRHGKVREWRNSLIEDAPRARTRKGQEQQFRDFDPNDPEAMRKRMASANRILTVLKAGLNHAKSELRRIATDAGWVDVKPFARVDVPKIRFLSDDEIKAFIPACELQFAKLCKGALNSGARYGELALMLVEDFSESQQQVFVRDSKNGESRFIDLNPQGVELFKSLCAGKGPKQHIFTKANGEPWGDSEQKRPMDDACEAAKVEGVTFHILRHTYASHSLKNGMRIEVLANQLGHKDTRITLRHYAHLCNTHKQEQVQQFAPTFDYGEQPQPTEPATAPPMPKVRSIKREAA